MVPYTILRNSNGNRNALYLYRNDDGSWNWNANWLDNNRNADNPALGVATLFISPLPMRQGSFVLKAVLIFVLATHQAFFLFPPRVSKEQYTFCYRVILFPITPSLVS